MSFDYAAKIAALIAHAEDEALPEAARASYRAKAEKLMNQYRIAEEDLIATDQFAAVPVKDVITVMETGAYDNPLRNEYWRLFSLIADHAGVRVAGNYVYRDYASGDYETKLEAAMVGYEGDIAYAKFIWTAARLVFLTRIDARRNPDLSDQENAYYMRNSGMPRNLIAQALWGSAMTDGTAHGRVQKFYLAECAKRQETPRVSGRGIQVDVYRAAYARSFVNQFKWRLREASDAAGTTGGGLVLHGRKERVDEAFYREYPKHRPMSPEEAARQDAQRAEEEANCPDCAKTKSKTGKCGRHRPTQVRQSDLARWDRMNHSPEARAGSLAGHHAAAAVNLQRGFDRKEAAAAPTERGAIAG